MKKQRAQPLPAHLRVLVLDGHSRAAVETVQSLGRARAHVTVAATDPAALAFASRHARRHLWQPAQPAVLADWIDELHARTPFDLIVPATETSLLAMRGLPETHPARVAAVLPGDDALDCALDKERMLAHAREVDVSVPASRLLTADDAAELDTPYPRVLKPVRSKVRIGGRWRTVAPQIVTDAAQREEVLAAWLPHMGVQEQEYVTGAGEGVNVLFDRGALRWSFTYRRVHEVPLTGGGSSYRRSLAPAADLLLASRRLLEPLAWHGAAMVEFKRRRDGTFALMEVNPRLWGSLALPIDCGVDFPRGLAALATGTPLMRQPRYRRAHYTRSLLDDVAWQKENLRADHGDPLLLTRSRVVSALEIGRVVLGLESWDHFRADDPRVGRRIITDIVREHVMGLGRRAGRVGWRLSIERRHEARFRDPRRLPRAVRRVLFLCYGNICRSPFAEIVAKQVMPDVDVSSSGFHLPTQRPSPEHIQTAARDMGYDVGAHRSSRVTAAMVAEADLILVMDHDNWTHLRREFPEARARTTCLGLYAEPPAVEIDDPYTADDAETRRVLACIESAVKRLGAALETPA